MPLFLVQLDGAVHVLLFFAAARSSFAPKIHLKDYLAVLHLRTNKGPVLVKRQNMVQSKEQMVESTARVSRHLLRPILS
jgi:hypothetical protein